MKNILMIFLCILRGYSSTTSLELTSQNLQDVKTMQLDGREVVVIGRETYVQIMEELAMLKHALSQLTEVIRVRCFVSSLINQIMFEIC